MNETIGYVTMEKCAAVAAGMTQEVHMLLVVITCVAAALMIILLIMVLDASLRRKYILSSGHEQKYQEWKADRRRFMD